jgi:hypothetical protein
MRPASWIISIVAAALAMAMACAKQSPSPSAPSVAAGSGADANDDGSLLKATAPTLQSPINGAQLAQGQVVTLVLVNSTTPYTSAVTLSYRFEVTNAAGVAVETTLVPAGAGTTSRTVAATLDGAVTYQWRARPEYQGTAGPWSARQSFVAPVNEGYVRGNELYDPLINGKTVGEINDTQFIPGVGIQLTTVGSFVTYHFPVTLTEGEFSAIFTNVTTIPENVLRRLITMRQGTAAINDNPYRMSVGVDNHGEFDWRFITGGPVFIKTEGDAERPRYPFKANLTYFVRATWRGGFFRVQFWEGGVNGTPIYDFGKNYVGSYTPSPHNVYLGNPYAPGDRGERVSCAGAIIRQVWVSGNPRPSYANR